MRSDYVTMDRRDFLRCAGLGVFIRPGSEIGADIVICGGGVGGCAAALAALEAGCTVVLTEESDWIGGQLTSQGVPPDEHQWIEDFGATRTYLSYRHQVRQHYQQYYGLTDVARAATYINPGNCAVSRICHEPLVSLSVLQALLLPWVSNKRLQVLTETTPVGADVMRDRVFAVRARGPTGDMSLTGKLFLDATEDGGLLPLTGTEFVTGAEEDTGEMHASSNTGPHNMQAATWCFAMDYVEGADNIADPPDAYAFWSTYVPPLNPPWSGPLLHLTYTDPITLEPRKASFDPRPGAQTQHFNLWSYRRLIDPVNVEGNGYASGITLVNWPQNDYMSGNLFGQPDAAAHQVGAKELSLALFHWLQTEVPREDGTTGWPGLRLRGDVMGTTDGLAKRPYIRESRRIRARFTLKEEHVGVEAMAQWNGGSADDQRSVRFEDSVGVGSYRLDLHPSTGGDNYIDVATLPFEIPLRSLIPERIGNLLPACKNLGVTHVTNGCYRLHPVEWNIGESAGCLAAYCSSNDILPAAVADSARHLRRFQRLLQARGVELHWPQSFY